jgi:ABC-type transport system substrate-binding protein
MTISSEAAQMVEGRSMNTTITQIKKRGAESPFALSDGYYDWVLEESELQQLYAQVMGTVDRERQQALIRQMERHTRDQAYFLFLYNPIGLYAVNKAVQFVPYVSPLLNLIETSVTEEHWSIPKQKAAVPE